MEQRGTSMAYRGCEQVLVYGARLAGQDVRDYLEKVGCPVHAFLDRDTSLTSVDNIPVFTSESWRAANDPSRACVIIGLFNNHVDVGAVVDHLERLGYRNIVSLVEFVRDYPAEQPFRYWLVDPAFYEQHLARIANFRAHLADEASRQLLDRIVEFRITGNYRCLPEPSGQQYFPLDLPMWPQPLRFIDCGAYIGDTVQAMREAGFEFEAVATFEPNLQNYQALVDNLKQEHASHFPCGVSDSNRLSGFDPALGSGGHLVAVGGDPVFCVRLDDALPGFAPNLIKMDVEGEEPAALRGGEAILLRHRPNLAISIYHRAEHLWSIFEQLQVLDLGYRFHLRCHARSTFETVLYALREN
jgi:FkbM family methyltransferase